MSKILMIDDDPNMVDLMQDLLEDDGHIVLKATEPLQAMKLFQDTTPDLVIIDIIMPELDGFALLRQFKETGIGFKSILLSGIDSDKARNMSKELGADYYLAKPVNIDDLKLIVKNLLRFSEEQT